ncbi:MAG: glutaredoxin 3 [Pseudomonadota bacterium]
MPVTEIYFKSWCPYSRRALALLASKRVDYTPIDVTNDPEREAEMRQRAGRTSVPQIFVGDRHLGGFDDIDALDRAGELDAILSGESESAAA